VHVMAAANDKYRICSQARLDTARVPLHSPPAGRRVMNRVMIGRIMNPPMARARDSAPALAVAA
jgi:hypothetical protein